MPAIMKDVWFGLRILRRSPWFTAVAVLTLGLGIAVNTTVFSWINSVLLHPFPGVGDPHELALIETVTPTGEYLVNTSVSRLPRLPGQSEAGLRSRPRAIHAPERRGRRKNGPRLGGTRLAKLLRSAEGQARAGPRRFCPKRDATGRRRPGCRHQLSHVADPVWRRPEGAGQNHPFEPAPVDHHRRGAPRSSTAPWPACFSTFGSRSRWPPRWAPATAPCTTAGRATRLPPSCG